MNKQSRCQPLVTHISRIQGQLETLKKYIHEQESCQEIAQMALSATKSFDSLKAKIIEGYIHEQLLPKSKISKKKDADIKKLMSLIKR